MIFLSYAREDVDVAEQLAKFLTAAGHQVWWDREILPGASWRGTVEIVLAEARCLIVLWSTSSVRSNWCIEEASDALERHILVPVRIDDCTLPFGFRNLETPDLSGWAGEDRPVLRRLLKAVERLTPDSGSETSGVAAPPPETARSENPPAGPADTGAEPGQPLIEVRKLAGSGAIVGRLREAGLNVRLGRALPGLREDDHRGIAVGERLPARIVVPAMKIAASIWPFLKLVFLSADYSEKSLRMEDQRLILGAATRRLRLMCGITPWTPEDFDRLQPDMSEEALHQAIRAHYY